ncbi:asparagine synthase (glutamine-hydrolyzing) [Thermostilla marina]
MCGITGAVWTDPKLGLSRSVLETMTRALAHRGPDDEGIHLAEHPPRREGEAPIGVGLGHRRLSIIDLSGGKQPMQTDDGSIVLVFNGEIYNHRALRRRLEGAGRRFRTRCDTEAILHLYAETGLEFVEHLNGMFALALWDAARRRLVLARDRLGEKPLFYCLQAGRLVFASELKSLLAAPGIPREVSPQSLDAFLAYQYVPHPYTIYRDISKLPPGHMAVFEDGKLDVCPYWRPDFNREHDTSYESQKEEIRERLRTVVRSRMESDVPLGAFLSGGIDSSLVVGLMQEASPEPVRTFSIGFPEIDFDETKYARIAAEAFGTHHEEFQVNPDALAILPQLVHHYDEPFADSSAIPTWYVSQMTRRRVTVALTGDGGDELFLGYPRYKAVMLASHIDRLPRWFRAVMGSQIWQSIPCSSRQKSIVRRAKRFLEAINYDYLERYFDWLSIFNQTRRAMLYREEFLARLPEKDPIEFLRANYSTAARRDRVTAIALTDLQTYLPCDLMTKVDIASMAHSLECRPPFLEHELVEWAAQLPRSAKLHRGRGKRILLDAFSDILPEPIRTRSKMGFGVPLGAWFRGPLQQLIRDVLLDERTLAREWFLPEAVRTLVAEHESGTFNHGHRLWALLMFELWQRYWLEGDRLEFGALGGRPIELRN